MATGFLRRAGRGFIRWMGGFLKGNAGDPCCCGSGSGPTGPCTCWYRFYTTCDYNSDSNTSRWLTPSCVEAVCVSGTPVEGWVQIESCLWAIWVKGEACDGNPPLCTGTCLVDNAPAPPAPPTFDCPQCGGDVCCKCPPAGTVINFSYTDSLGNAPAPVAINWSDWSSCTPGELSATIGIPLNQDLNVGLVCVDSQGAALRGYSVGGVARGGWWLTWSEATNNCLHARWLGPCGALPSFGTYNLGPADVMPGHCDPTGWEYLVTATITMS